jgi:hypothetical protein
MEDDMSTRAIYTFCDSDDEAKDVHVYKHHDGYPYNGGVHNGTAYEAGGLVWINDAKAFAWDLPRFEADEFAASFVAANKSDGGGVRLIGDQKPWEYASDCDYWYKVWLWMGDLHVTVMSVDWFGEVREHCVEMEGSLDELLATQRARKEVA